MTGSKDSGEAIQFLTLFSRVKECCDDVPENLLDDSMRDEAVKKVCEELHMAAFSLQINERSHRQLFIAPVDPKFVKSWRDFEERYESIVGRILLADLLSDMDPGESKKISKSDFNWEWADDQATEQSQAIETAIDFARTQSEEEWRDFPENYTEKIDDGIRAWKALSNEVGFDLRGVFRRRELVPFVLVPRHVADRHGSSDKVSIYKNLQQAHDAFIFGAPLAALALMRSIMEALLRDHYGAKGTNLEERINSVSRSLPNGANSPKLHWLRKFANAVLHLDAGRAEFLPDFKSIQLEKEIVSLLFVLRALVEGAPQRRIR